MGADVGTEDVYWQTHSLIFGSIAATSESQGENPTTDLKLKPVLRISGSIDPGKVPELSATIEPKKFGVGFRIPSVGSSVLVLLVQKGEAYSVPPDRLDFMPGDHTPICEVKDFADPKVLDCVKAVQELRKKRKTDGSEPKPPK